MGSPWKPAGATRVFQMRLAPETLNSRNPKTMTKTLSTRGLILAGALAFAALPALAHAAPSTQTAAPTAGSTVAPGTTTTGKSTTDASKTHHAKRLAKAHTKSKIHTVSAKKSVDSNLQKPATGSTSGSGTAAPATKP